MFKICSEFIMANENIQIAIEINILLRASLVERQKYKKSPSLDLLIKEYLKIQEFLLVFSENKPNVEAISKWTIKLIDSDDKLANSLLGNKFKIFAKKLASYSYDE